MKRRSFAQVAELAVFGEREAAAAYAERQCAAVRALAARGRVGEEDADLLCRRLTEFAAGIRAGLHVDERAPEAPKC